MRGCRKFCQRRSNFDNGGFIFVCVCVGGVFFCFVFFVLFSSLFFLVDEGREDPRTTISGRFAGVPMMAQH